MIGAILLVIAAVALVGALTALYRRNRIRRAAEKMHDDYLRELAILQQNYFATYSAMLQAAQQQTDGWQF